MSRELLLVVDRSATMGCNLPPLMSSAECEAEPVKVAPDEPSKLEGLAQALETVLPRLGATAEVALSWLGDEGECAAALQPQLPYEIMDASRARALSQEIHAAEPRGIVHWPRRSWPRWSSRRAPSSVRSLSS